MDSSGDGTTLKVTVAMFGLDNAGKTSLVNAIGGQPTTDATPTMGFAPHTFMGGQFELSVYDLGGAERFRGIWRNYYSDVHGFLYVVDSSDKGRLAETTQVLKGILADPRAAGKPLLIMANKQDAPGAIKGDALLAALDVKLGPGVSLIECVAVVDPADPRIDVGMEWLLSNIASGYQALCSRIRTQTAADKENQDKQRRDQRERVHLNKKTDYIQSRDVHYFFEHLAGKILLDMPKDPMAYIICELEKSASGVKKINTAMFGLDNAGKTSLVHAIGGQPTTDTTPTVGFVPHAMKNKSYEVTVFDLGGAANFRGIWSHYYADVHGISFVVDSSDKDRFIEAAEVLKGILADPRAAGKPLLIMANKQDAPGAIKGDALLAALGVKESGGMVKMVECVGISDPADPRIDAGMEWMIQSAAERYALLSVRIVQHLAEDKAKRRVKLEEQRARLQPNDAAPALKDTRTEAERGVAYIKETGVHYMLERLAGQVLLNQPEDFVAFLLAEAQKK